MHGMAAPRIGEWRYFFPIHLPSDFSDDNQEHDDRAVLRKLFLLSHCTYFHLWTLTAFSILWSITRQNILFVFGVGFI